MKTMDYFKNKNKESNSKTIDNNNKNITPDEMAYGDIQPLDEYSEEDSSKSIEKKLGLENDDLMAYGDMQELDDFDSLER